MQVSSSSNGMALSLLSSIASTDPTATSSEVASSNSADTKTTAQASINAAPTSLLSSSTLMSILNMGGDENKTAAETSTLASYSADPASDPQLMDVTGITGSAGGEISPGIYSTPGYSVSGSEIASVESQLGVVGVYGTMPDGSVDTSTATVYMDNGQPASDALSQKFIQMINTVGYDDAQSGASSATDSNASSGAGAFEAALTSANTQTSASEMLSAQASLEDQLMQSMSA